MAGLKEIHEWWEIPSIVYICNTLSLCCKDISPVSIERFENGLIDNTNILMNMAIRFVKVCGFYETTSDEWWYFMKTLFKNHCPVYGYEDPLGTAKCFNDLLRKQKVETLYILSHFVLDVEDLQEKLKNKPEILSRLNVKPLGYDLQKSVYWYFGGTRLYREDFDNIEDLSELLNPEQNETNSTTVTNESKDKVERVLQNDPYLSSILGTGKWKLICDDKESWLFLSDKTGYSRNINIIMLHKCLCNIIASFKYSMLLQPKKYKYIAFRSQVINKKKIEKIKTTDIFKEKPANEEKNTTGLHVDRKPIEVLVDNYRKTRRSNRLVNKGVVQLQEAVYKNTSTLSVQKNSSSSLKIIANKLSKLQYPDTNQQLQQYSMNKTNVGLDLIKVRQDCLQRVVRVYIERYDQENMHNIYYTESDNHNRLRKSTRLRTEKKHHPLKNLSCYVSI